MSDIRLTSLIATVGAILAVNGNLSAAPPSTAPVDGLRQNTPHLHALVGATIVAAPKPKNVVKM